MAGPGGGNNGGGGHGGGRSSGGQRSSGQRSSRGRRVSVGYRNGGFHYGYGGYHHRPYHHYGVQSSSISPGCAVALFAAMAIFIIVLFVLPNLFSNKVSYNEHAFQDFANAEYKKAFGESTAYEDNILVVFLTTDSADEYHYIGWVGDHINYDINCLFGNENTELGRAMSNSINNAGYWYSLDTNLASVVKTMTNEVEKLNVNSFTCSENHKQVESKIVNYTNFELTEELVNTALKDFTDKTDIPMVIVVEDSKDVF